MQNKKTCQDLIQEQFESRNKTIADMTAMFNGDFEQKINEAVEEFIEKTSTATGQEPDENEIARFVEEQYKNCEYTETSLDELALGFVVNRLVKIELSTGGPADFIEVFLDDDCQIIKAVYHYQDWFDGAQLNVPDDSHMMDYIEHFIYTNVCV